MRVLWCQRFHTYSNTLFSIELCTRRLWLVDTFIYYTITLGTGMIFVCVCVWKGGLFVFVDIEAIYATANLRVGLKTMKIVPLPSQEP